MVRIGPAGRGPSPANDEVAPVRPAAPPADAGATDVVATTRRSTPTAVPAPAPAPRPRSGALPISVGATSVPDRATFEKLARRDDVPGALGAREVKFLMTDVDGPNPKMYLINTNNHVYHYDFATKGLGKRISLEQFNAQTYFRDDRKNIAGTIIAHDSYQGARGQKGLYSVEFWPTDPVKAASVAKAFKAIETAMPFAKGKLAYHPAGDTQEALAKAEATTLRRLGVPTISTTDLFKNVSYSALNLGEGFGTLRVVDPSQPDARPPTVRDVVIFKSIPNDLAHVGGVITEAPQTPLSHVNLKAKQNDTPNAYVKDASKDPRVAPLVGKLVHYKVTPDGFEIREATQAEADAYLEKMRPPRPQRPPRDLSAREIVDIDRIGNARSTAFGAKAANVAELRKILPAGMVPDGHAVPFHFYDKFMKESGLYDEAKRMMADPRFKSDPAVREDMLARFRRRIRDTDIPPDLARKLRAIQATYPPGTPIRARSSTNNEDLVGFNGAGLYDSFTHRPDEGNIDRTVKQVWASLWNFRAFEERDFYRIDHMSAAMGVLLHPNFDDEVANGVAVTKNIYDPNWPGFYVNVQVGEELVTNPGAGATPDELLVSAIGPRGEYETQYIRHSNQVRAGKTVLTKPQVAELTKAMEKIQAHFKKVYGREADNGFAMDIEFKIDKDGKLVVKQARPWVD